MDLQVDESRMGLPECGIFVRAQHHGKWGSHDIAHLSVESLNDWLRSRGGENEWAESVVRVLLGYP